MSQSAVTPMAMSPNPRGPSEQVGQDAVRIGGQEAPLQLGLPRRLGIRTNCAVSAAYRCLNRSPFR
jgi:hypothetical protein